MSVWNLRFVETWVKSIQRLIMVFFSPKTIFVIIQKIFVGIWNTLLLVKL